MEVRTGQALIKKISSFSSYYQHIIRVSVEEHGVSVGLLYGAIKSTREGDEVTAARPEFNFN